MPPSPAKVDDPSVAILIPPTPASRPARRGMPWRNGVGRTGIATAELSLDISKPSVAPGEHSGDAAAATHAELGEDALQVRSHGRNLDAEAPGDLLVAEIV